MSLQVSNGNARRKDKQGIETKRRDRFAAYFPRLFAYVHSLERDEMLARECVVGAFTQAFAGKNAEAEEDFIIALFSAARSRLSPAGGEDNLTDRERAILSLLFDAQLTRSQVAAVLGLSDDLVTGDLVGGLKKLRRAAGNRPAQAFS